MAPDLPPVPTARAGIDFLRQDPTTAAEQRRADVIRIQAAMADAPKNTFAGIAAVLLAATLISRDGTDALGRWLPWVWCAVLLVEVLRMLVMCLRFPRQPRTEEETLGIARRVGFSNMLIGLLWGSVAWLVIPSADSRLESLLVIGHAVMMMGAIGSKGLYRPWALRFTIPAIVVFDLGLLRAGDEYHAVIAGVFVLFAYVLLSFSKTQDRTLQVAIILRFRTEQLLQERTAQQRETHLAREEADRANQGKTTFLAGAGHDLRQPMHALVQYFGHLKRRNLDPALEDTIGRIGKSLDSMQDLLDSILDVSKLMMGSVKPLVSTFELAPMLDRLDAQMGPIAEDKRLRLTIRQTPGILLRTDPVLLERVLRNLVLNAIRYTDRDSDRHGGSVTISAVRRGSRAVIRVADSGIGIPRRERERIFEAFYQIGNQARDRRKGLGLGLAIVRQLADLLDLTLRLRSKPGKGSIFSVTLPTVPMRAPSEERAEAGPGHDFAPGAFVVLIDDSPESLEATCASLQEFGCRVLAAASSEEAIGRLDGENDMPHLIVSDFRLEHETGLDAIERVVAHQQAVFGPELDIAALVVSGDTGPAEMARVRQAGYPMLHKPVPFDALHAAVNAQLALLAGCSPSTNQTTP